MQERQSACKVDSAQLGRKQRPVVQNMDCTEWGAKILVDMINRPDPSLPMPRPRATQIRQMDEIRANQWERHFEQFMSAIGLDGESSGLIEAPTGHALYVSLEMFTDHKTKKLKIDKEGRDKYLLFLAASILGPDEVWLQQGGHKDQKLEFLTRYVIDGGVVSLLATFKQEGKVWTGWSGYQSMSPVYLESKRNGELLWRRP